MVESTYLRWLRADKKDGMFAYVIDEEEKE